MVNGDSNFGDMKDQERRSSEGKNRVVFCVIEVPITLPQGNAELAIEYTSLDSEKGQAQRHKFEVINIQMIFKAVGMDEPGGQ